MAFDLSTARPVQQPKTGGFDLSTARPVGEPEQPTAAPEQPAPSFYDRLRASLTDAKNVAAEGASAFNRSLVQGLDFIGPGFANAVMRQTGVDYQLPTLEGGFNELPGEQGGFMQAGLGRDVVRGFGAAAPAALGAFPVAGRNIATPLGAVAEFVGLGTAKAAPNVAPLSFAGGQVAAQAPPAVARASDFMPVSKKAQTINQLVQEGSGNVQRAMYQLSPYTGSAVVDDSAKYAEKQGFAPELIAMVQSFNRDTKNKAAQMLDIVAQGKDNMRYAADNRPLNIIGNSVLNRIKVVREANRVAAVRLDDVAKGLKGESVDVSPAINDFIANIQDMGIQIDPATMKMNFQGSDIEKLRGPQKILQNMVDRLLNTKTPDAYDVHRVKRFIDEQVSYGKSQGGLTGRAEGIVKSLRHGLDSILDSQFPSYNQVNTQYAETRGVLDGVQDIAGKKFDADDASAALTMGSLARRFMSNAQSNGYLRDAISDLDAVARKYIQPGTDIVPYKPIQSRSGVTPAMLENDDLIGLAQFSDQLDKMFGTHAGTSLRGDVDKGVEAGIEAATGQMTIPGALMKGGKLAYQKLRRINADNQIKAMRELLRQGD